MNLITAGLSLIIALLIMGLIFALGMLAGIRFRDPRPKNDRKRTSLDEDIIVRRYR